MTTPLPAPGQWPQRAISRRHHPRIRARKCSAGPESASKHIISACGKSRTANANWPRLAPTSATVRSMTPQRTLCVSTGSHTVPELRYHALQRETCTLIIANDSEPILRIVGRRGDNSHLMPQVCPPARHLAAVLADTLNSGLKLMP